MHLRMLKERAYDVERLQDQLICQPELWDAVRLRTEHPQSPHRETSDIWVRYNTMENYHGDMQRFNAEHRPEWYPVVDRLTEAKQLALEVALDYEALDIGMVLITRIPPGCQVYPHIDGGWHARHFEKFAIQVKGNAEQAFHFKDEDLITRDGDLFWFDNAYPHWVTNPSAEDRITLIVCLRRH